MVLGFCLDDYGCLWFVIAMRLVLRHGVCFSVVNLVLRVGALGFFDLMVGTFVVVTVLWGACCELLWDGSGGFVWCFRIDLWNFCVLLMYL